MKFKCTSVQVNKETETEKTTVSTLYKVAPVDEKQPVEQRPDTVATERIQITSDGALNFKAGSIYDISIAEIK